MHQCVEAHKEAVVAQRARDLLVAVHLPKLCPLLPEQVFVGEVAPAASPTIVFRMLLRPGKAIACSYQGCLHMSAHGQVQ